jgi:hypothetical protein
VRHEESKKNEYLNEGKRLSHKVRECEKLIGERNTLIAGL